tara:strand:+ start:38976 stop:39482 length:507 start_codon:yes stop_codon:yes gene_type:complete
MKTKYTLLSAIALSGLLVSCGDKEKTESTEKKPAAKAAPADKEHDDHEGHDDHDHGEEAELGSHEIEGIKVEAAQGHGAVEAGKEGHLILKLPYNDKGETVVRVWIGTADKTLSSAGKGVYAPSHDDYDIHTVAPDPLPADTKWWVEITKPDGMKATGSIPLLKDISK